jgi:hypothetical protein
MTADALIQPALRARPTLTKVIVAASIGNAMEWFDFLVYGYFAVTISKVFFPSENETASLLLTLGTFGALMSCARSARSSSAPTPTAAAAEPGSPSQSCLW